MVAVNEFEFNRKPCQRALLGKAGNELVGVPQSRFVFVGRSRSGKRKRESIITVRLKLLIEKLQKASKDRRLGGDLSTSFLKRKPVSR